MPDIEALKATLPYRPCVGIMLINRQGQVFVGRRINSEESGGWQMPQGGIEDGEDPRTAALRELKEEIGTDRAEIIGQSSDWLTYDLPDHLVGKVWQGRYRGQKQKWFVMRFVGDDRDINLDHHDHPEFSAYQWVDREQLPALVVAFKVSVYEQLVSEFRQLVEQVERG